MSQVCYSQVSIGSLFEGVSEFSLKPFLLPRNSHSKKKRSLRTMQNQSSNSVMQRYVMPKKDFIVTALASTDGKVTNTANTVNDRLFQEFSAKLEQNVPVGSYITALKLISKLAEIKSLIDNHSDKVLIHQTCREFNVLLPGDCFALRGKIYELAQECVVADDDTSSN